MVTPLHSSTSHAHASRPRPTVTAYVHCDSCLGRCCSQYHSLQAYCARLVRMWASWTRCCSSSTIQAPTRNAWYNSSGVVGDWCQPSEPYTGPYHTLLPRKTQWDVQSVQLLESFLPTDTQQLALVRSVLDDFEATVKPIEHKLAKAIVQNDANSSNLIMKPDGSDVYGIIGMFCSYTV